ncbi:uncharacterized protein LOC126571101 [Anopheles aquasalis]|uniref:uncharacterized protein LOC126571101 n=1 Tax=Anopheles aquasalis TaxID=42839 RepID=UPI00215AF826|nr:uncharacterized protein LOC126571101 [Anopheles aquasalis]
MFKYVFVVLALIAAAFAAPKPQLLYSPAAYSSYVAPAAATVYSSNAYVPASAYSAYAPAAYSAYAPAAYAYL